MKIVKVFLLSLAAACLIFTSVTVGISAEQKGQGTKGAAPMDEEFLRDLSKKAALDTATVKELAETMSKRGLSRGEFIRLVLLAREKTDEIIYQGKAAEPRRAAVMKENINYLYDRLRGGSTWKQLWGETQIPSKGDAAIKEAVFQKLSEQFSVGIADLRGIEEEFRRKEEDDPLRKTVMLTILARVRTDKLVKEGKFARNQEGQAMRDSVNYFREQIKRDMGWGDLAGQVEMTGFEINSWANWVLTAERDKP